MNEMLALLRASDQDVCMPTVAEVREQNGYGAFRRGEHCELDPNLVAQWRVTYSDGTVRFFCEAHAPREGRIYTGRCQFPGCLDETGEAPKVSVRFESNGERRCADHLIDPVYAWDDAPSTPSSSSSPDQ